VLLHLGSFSQLEFEAWNIGLFVTFLVDGFVCFCLEEVLLWSIEAFVFEFFFADALLVFILALPRTTCICGVVALFLGFYVAYLVLSCLEDCSEDVHLLLVSSNVSVLQAPPSLSSLGGYV
jgi:hypothetical protein